MSSASLSGWFAMVVLLTGGHEALAQDWCPGFGSPGFDSQVFDLIEFEGDLIACGSFNYNGDATLPHVARWNGAAWQPMGDVGLFQEARSLSVFDGELYLSGRMYESYPRLMRWNGSTWDEVAPGLEPDFSNVDGTIEAMLVRDGKLVVVGVFAGYWDGQTLDPDMSYVAAWNGTAWESLGTGIVNGLVMNDLISYQGDLIVGGVFDGAGSAAAHSLARWNGSSWSAISGDFAGSTEEGIYWSLPSSGRGYVNALAEYSGLLVIGGSFDSVGSTVVSNLVAYDGVTSTWQQLGSGPDGAVHDLHVHGGKLYAAGDFTTIGGVSAGGLAVWDGIAWAPLGSGEPGGTVRALLSQGPSLIAGGHFPSFGGTQYGSIAAWDGLAFAPMRNAGAGLNLRASSAVLHGGSVVVSGRFSGAGEVAARRMASYDGSGWSEFGGGADAPVDAWVDLGAELVAGGTFSEIGGQAIANVARFDGTQWHAYGNGTAGPVRSLVMHDGTLYAGGADFIEFFDGANWSSLTTDPPGRGADALASFAGTLVAAQGTFLKAYDGAQWIPLVGTSTGWGISYGWVETLAVHEGMLYVGGNFTDAGDGVLNAWGLARWDGNNLEAYGKDFYASPGDHLLNVHQILSANGTLVIAGEPAYTRSNIYWLDGTETAWLGVPYPDTVFGTIHGLVEFQGQVHAAGLFTRDFTETPIFNFAALCEMPTATPASIGARLRLEAHPNPFNPKTSVTFFVPQPQQIRLEVVDLAGRRVRTLVDGPLSAGQQSVDWDGRNARGVTVASGVYVLRLSMGERQESRPVALLK